MTLYKSGRGKGTSPNASMTLNRQQAAMDARKFWKPAQVKAQPAPGTWALSQWTGGPDLRGTIACDFKGRPKRED